MPFLGSRETEQPSFSYLLRDVSSHGVGLVVPPQEGMIALEVGERVNFHLPFQLNEKFYNQGVIRWQQPAAKGQICGAQLDKRVPLRYPIYVAFDTGDIRFGREGFGISGMDELIARILEDAFYFKKGVSIYFEHLVPYFTRHSLRGKIDRPRPDQDAVPRIRKQIAENIHVLEGLKRNAAEKNLSRSFPAREDLESLRKAVMLELNFHVLSDEFDAAVILPYLRSVRLLEHQLYSNLNTLVLVHLQSRRPNS